MSEKLAKKLGEVLAFARCDRETFEKARVALTSAFNDGHQSILDSFIAEIVQIESFASATTLAQAEKTTEKLRSMRDLYIGEEWDNATEVLEWLGFFEGAAIVHWNLVKSLAEKEGQKEIVDLAATGFANHQKIFERVNAAISK